MIKNKIKFSVLGIDHDHIFHMIRGLQNEGCIFNSWWTKGNPTTLKKFLKTFPKIKRVKDKKIILEDKSVNIILISSIPKDRAHLSISAMEFGKNVMVDKPGCISIKELSNIKACVKKTKKIWAINFSERFEFSAVQKAEELVSKGLIGNVIQTIGLGPHKIGNLTRPSWFYDPKYYGGIITDIASHQIHQFLVFTKSTNVKIINASIISKKISQNNNFQKFGEINLLGNRGVGYIRVDWMTPKGLNSWGDTRLFIQGEKGFIELRKNIDLAKSKKGNHLFYANNKTEKYIDCSNIKLIFYKNFLKDCKFQNYKSNMQKIFFITMEVAILSQIYAEKNKSQKFKIL